ncbi:NAD-dependent epimerase/dehydratase family protein [Tardisphaera saccharovorans]
MKAVVTGSSGFIGFNVAEWLSKSGYDVVAVDVAEKPEDLSARYAKLDLTDKEAVIRLVESERPDYVLHYAAITTLSSTISDPYSAFFVNDFSTLNLLEASSRIGVKRFVYASSVLGSTKVHVKWGQKEMSLPISALWDVPISDVTVKSVNPLTGKADYMPISSVIRHRLGKKDLYRIWYKKGAERSVVATGDHSVFVLTDDGMLKAREVRTLEAGTDYLFPDDGYGVPCGPDENALLKSSLSQGAEITEIEQISDDELKMLKAQGEYDGYVYDISVPGSEAFFGGDVPVLLHNSSNVYGAPLRNPVREDDPFAPRVPYDHTKVVAEYMISAYAMAKRIPYSITRSWLIFGEHDKPNRAVPIFIRKAVRDEPITLYNSGRDVTDPYHVSNYLKALEVILKDERAIGQAYNVGTGSHMSVAQMAQSIVDILGSHSKLILAGPRSELEAQPQISYPSIEKITGLGYSPVTSFKDGILKTKQWMEKKGLL